MIDFTYLIFINSHNLNLSVVFYHQFELSVFTSLHNTLSQLQHKVCMGCWVPGLENQEW